jgi:anti-sigma factor RsiW
MTCEELTTFLCDYLDKALPPHVHTEFEEHLGRCDDCLSYLDSYRKTIALSKSAMRGPVDAEQMPESLLRAILRARQHSPET